ncbi:MAG: hypothetical protein V1816_13775 [Pseudomonadota bacterium]
MSSEIVVVAALFSPVSVPLLLGVAAAAALAKIREDRARALELKKKEQAFFEKWRQGQDDARREVEGTLGLQSEILTALQGLKAAGDFSVPSKKSDASGRGFLDVGHKKTRAPEPSRPLFQELVHILDHLPTEFKDDRAWPHERFQEQRRKYETLFAEGRGPGREELLAFGETISRTLDRYRKQVEAAKQTSPLVLEKCAGLFERASYLGFLTRREALRTELEAITTFLVSGRAEEKDLDRLAARLDDLAGEIDVETEKRAYLGTLAESLSHKLGELGYEAAGSFADFEGHDRSAASFKCPGGGRLRAAIQSDGRMDFRLDPGKAAGATPAAVDSFRRGEEKWCRDFQELLRRLTGDGFSFRIELERTRPASSLPVVAVVEAEELVDEDDEFWDGDAPRRRGRDD